MPFLAAKVSQKAAALAAVTFLAACAGGQSSGLGEVNDPFEPWNRKVHAFNKGADRAVVRPIATAYGTIVPSPVRTGVSNVADVLRLPVQVANNLLQADIENAAINTLRLGVNLSFGLGGLIDVASGLGMPDPEGDFGQTLAVWGVGEGPYLELPLKGPSTVRDATGFAVDVLADPVDAQFDGDDAKVATGVKVLELLDDRYSYSGLVESVLYESADSYAQARLLYLQNRRFKLGQQGGDAAADASADFIDPYED